MTVPGNYFLKKWGTSGKVPPEPCIWQMGFLDSQTGTPVLAYDPAPGHRTLCLLVTKAHNSGQSHLCTGCVWSGPGDQSSSSREGEARQSLDWREKHVLECGLQAAGVRRPERCCSLQHWSPWEFCQQVCLSGLSYSWGRWWPCGLCAHLMADLLH